MLGLVERERAYSTVHEGAVYLHMGEAYHVLGLDHESRTALVEPFTRRLLHPGEEGDDDVDRREPRDVETRLGMEVSFGRVSVTEQVVGYQKKSIRDQATLDLVPLLMPETTFETEAVWYLPEDWMLDGRGRRCRGSSARSTRPSTR